jgi:hypothetical protein
MTYRMPPAGRVPNQLRFEDLVCKETRISHNQTSDSPSLSARAGDTLLLFYQENGHVTKIEQDPGHWSSGTITVFGTSYPSSADSLQRIISESNTLEGLSLLHESSFDDGFCYQDNGSQKENERKKMNLNRPRLAVEGPDVWCSVEVTLSTFLKIADVYLLYWIWNFDGIGFVERYTTCMDVTIF